MIIKIDSEKQLKEIIAKNKKVIIKFYADWCPPCRQLEPIIEEISNEKNDLIFAFVNIDSLPKLREEYNVLSIPTLVLVIDQVNNNELIGFAQKNELLDFIG